MTTDAAGASPVECGVGRPVEERDDFGDDPSCGKCGAPITTGAMALLCPHGRHCEFVEGDEHWATVERCRKSFGIKRRKTPNEKGNRPA